MKKHVQAFGVLFLILIFTSAFQAFGQNIQISGKVMDASTGQTLPGVSILVKNTTVGTTTNLNGSYSIQAKIGSNLVFSYIGYQTQTIVVGNKKVINVTLHSSAIGLNELVVVGYGVQKKKDVTGATSTLGEKNFNRGVVIAPAQMMEGRIAGVDVTQNTGQPGGASTVRIRGNSSIRSNQDPLYVVDGVPLNNTNATPSGDNVAGVTGSESQNPLNFLNPDDIASITVLKDASATAIYGSRGSNGVILITTKKGHKGKGHLTYSAYQGVSVVAKKLNLLSAADFIKAGKQYGFDLINKGANTNWQNEIFRTAYTESHNLSYSGGTDNSSYYASIGYLNQQGVIKRTGLKKFTGRFNVTKKLFNDRLNISTNLAVARTKDSRVPIGSTGGYEGDVIISTVKANPTFPVYNADGSYFQYSTTIRNPLAMINLTNDNTYTDHILGNISASYLIFKGLTFKTNIGVDHTNATRKVSENVKLSYLVNGGQASIANIGLDNELWENYLTYDKQLNKANHITVLLGQSYQKFDNTSYNLSENGFRVADIDYIDNLGYGNLNQATVGSDKQENELQSFYARVNYSFKDKYLFTGTWRADGSTKFGKNNKYGYFPSIGLAWRLTQEDFIKNLNIFDHLKLRLGWGQTGNQNIPNQISQMVLGTSADANYYFDGDPTKAPMTGTTFTQTPNPNIKWETTTQTNIGLDFGFFNGRLSGSFDYFYKSTKDVLLQLTALAPAPTATMWENVPKMRILNSGIELSLTGDIIAKKDLTWNTTFNFSTVHNEVKDLPVDMIQTGVASGSGLSNTDVQVIKSGLPIGTFWGKKFLGYAADGTSIYQKDAKGNDIRENLGSALPKFTLGFSSDLTYKKFDFSFFLHGVFGNKVYNNLANAQFNIPSLKNNANVPHRVLNTGETALNTPEFSSRFIENGSFLRLSNVSLGYNLSFKNNSWIRSLRIYVTGSNLFLITKYSGYDPEVSTNAANNGVPSLGMDYTAYPHARTVQFGVNARF